jgi:hypothetical protein
VVSEPLFVCRFQAVGSRVSKRTVRWTVGNAENALGCRVNNRLSKRAGRRKKMATEGHGRGRREDHQPKGKDEMDKELAEVRARMEQLALKMQAGCKDTLGV